MRKNTKKNLYSHRNFPDMSRKIYLIVTAGGSGTRMGADIPKQFLPLAGKAILHRTIERFVEAQPGIRVITVLPAAHIPLWKEYCQKAGFNQPQTIVEGGITRFHSVRNALAKVPDGAIAAIHDGVRPLISIELIRTMFSQMKEGTRALIPVIPTTDTLKSLAKVRLSDGTVGLEPTGEKAPERSFVWGAQTPQIFLSEDIKAAYSLPFDTSFTDDASVAEAKKIPLSYTEGERFNIKITTPEDMLLAEALIQRT